jgi:hypothetical protein
MRSDLCRHSQRTKKKTAVLLSVFELLAPSPPHLNHFVADRLRLSLSNRRNSNHGYLS